MATFTDLFERADSTDLGVDWAELTSAGNWDIASGAVGTIAGASRNLLRCERTATSDQEVEAPVTAGTGLTMVAARVDNGTSEANSTYYRFGTNGSAWRIDRIVSGTVTNLVSSTETPPAFPYTLKLRVVGSALTGYVNGLQKVTVTDTGIPAGTKSGLATFGNNGQRFGSFTVSDYSATTQHPAAGTVAGTSATSASATLRAAAAGVVAAATVLTGAAAGLYPTSGTSAATSATTAAAAGRYGAGGTTAATSSTSGVAEVLTGAQQHPAAGTVAATSGTTGSATAKAAAAGTVAATSDTSGAASQRHDAAGTVTAVSATSGAAAVVSGQPVVERTVTLARALPDALTATEVPPAITVRALPAAITVRSLP